MLDPQTLKHLQGRKVLLAFSGGSDSTALFHLLLDASVSFDIAHVNYRTRESSDAEAAHASVLAQRHGKICHQIIAPPIEHDFEAKARDLRYRFFEQLIAAYGYDTLLTAHHLGDRLEWFLMQLCKGAGVYELLGMRALEEREGYHLMRPLLHVNKTELTEYLRQAGIAWCEDESNRDERFLRNRFRHRFGDRLLETYTPGIQRSFKYLEEDTAFEMPQLHRFEELTLFATLDDARRNGVVIDRLLKARGHLMRQGDRNHLKVHQEWVVGRRFSVSITPRYTYIAPYRRRTMDKAFKEECRTLGIPPLQRGYLFESPDVFRSVVALVSCV
ncbi:MAG: tRNA lysidine(34) synthetase TilS [Campylobacterales bacterium]|nr:tRNA lysidine(34) synthetase TilS [Campylobacterales bacterium]